MESYPLSVLIDTSTLRFRVSDNRGINRRVRVKNTLCDRGVNYNSLIIYRTL